jgi:Tol biopolymer transport system component
MSASAPGPLSNTTIGRFRIDRLLGRGGMGDVYRAEDSELHRAVALKILPEHLVGDSDRLARFIQEARTASALNHPHVVSIYDIGQGTSASGKPIHFIAMELVSGETLRSLVDRRAADLRHVLDYAAQAADALAAAHAAGIIHRDLKLENIMVAEGGYVKVLDFGLAKLKPTLAETAVEGPTVAAGTAAGVVMGTVGYMSPEQAQGLPVDLRTDVFAFGCILYEAASGTRAFSGKSAIDTLHQIINLDPVPLAQRSPAVPGELQRIVQKCLQKDPESRYQSMKEIAIDLRGLRRQSESGPSSTVAAAAPANRWRFVAIAGAVIALSAALVAALAGLRLFNRPIGPREQTAQQPLTIRRLTDTGIVTDAVTSPDGTYIAFVESSGGRQGLYLRQLTGARQIELIPPSQVGFWGLTFARDGQSIYYAVKAATSPAGELFQIPVLGGTSHPLLTDIESNVTFSPDRKSIAFYRVDLSTGASSIVVADADGSHAQAVVTKQPPEFFAPGFFVSTSWSPDGKRIAACVRNSATRDARLVTFDLPTGAESSYPDRFSFASATAWLPDGSGILFTAVPSGGVSTANGGQIYLQPFPSGALRRITTDVIEYRNVSVAADGRSIVSVGFDASGRLSEIPYGDGDDRRIQGTRYDGTSGIGWFPDGSRILFTRVVQGQRTMWSAAADGSDQRQIGEGPGAWPAISPDGRTLVFFAVRKGEVGLWRGDADGGNATLLTKVGDATSIVFAPDGGSVFFTSTTRGALATYRQNILGGEPALVAPLFERAGVSHDGKRLAGVYRESARAPLTLAVIDTETGKPLAQFGNFLPSAGTSSVAWTPDDKAVLYTTAERSNIWRRTIANGREDRVTNFSDLAILRFALSPDGRTFLLSRGTLTRDAFLLSSFR